MANSPLSPDKHDFLTKKLCEEYVLVHVNPHCAGVRLPASAQRDATVTLKISKFFKFPVDLSQHEVRARLRFGEEYFSCSIPLDAIWGATSVKGETAMWPEHLPASLQSIVKSTTKASKTPAPDAVVERPLDDAGTSTPSPRSRGHLKLVK